MIKVRQSGNFNQTERFLTRIQQQRYFRLLSLYGEEGVRILSEATPKKTGQTAASWAYKVTGDTKSLRLEWYNTNLENQVPVAILIQYGHGTGSGAFVEGRDYINPAMKPLFDRMAIDMWMEVIGG